VEDYARSYPIGGIMWGAERQSGFLNALNATEGGRGTCFCEFCQKKGKDIGIDVERARRVWRPRKVDGRPQGESAAGRWLLQFVWRILLNYPRIDRLGEPWVRGRTSWRPICTAS